MPPNSPLLQEKLKHSGERIKALRGLSGLTRKEFEERYGIKEITLKSWEFSRTSMRDYHLKRLIEVFKEEGIICSEEWILKGEGATPFLLGCSSEVQRELSDFKNIKNDPILLESEIFKRYNKNSTIYKLPDNSMDPLFKEGETVGGIKLPTLKETIFGEPYIVFSKKYGFLLRLIYPGNKEGSYSLISKNPEGNKDISSLHNVKVEQIYKIIWYRKPF